MQTLFNPNVLASCTPPCNVNTAHDKVTKVIIPVIIPCEENLGELEINKRKQVCW